MKLFSLSCLILLTATPVQSADISAGQAIVEQECSECHAVAITGDSPNPKAPSFRSFVRRYPPHRLVEAFTDSTSIAHGDMPEFMFGPEDIHEITSYLEILRAK